MPTIAATPARLRRRYAARRDAILAAAVEVFHDSGVSGFTLAAVAKRMDLHPVSLTYYFKHKEDLAAAVLLESIARHDEMLDLAETEPEPTSRLRRFIQVYFATRARIVRGEAAALAPFSEIRLIEGPQTGAVIAAFEELYVRLSRLFKSEAMPWIAPQRRHALARFLMSLLTWSESWLQAYPPEDYPRIADRIADILIRGVAAPGQTWPRRPLLALGSPVALNDEVTRERFLVAATELINREGYRGASVDKISAELKVTKGSFYHHNADKEELAAACFQRSFELIDDARRRAAEAPSAWERLWLSVASLTLHQAAGRGGQLMRHYSLAAAPLPTRKALLIRFQQIAHSFAGLISDGIAEGSIRPVEPLLAAHVIMVAFNSGNSLDPRSRPGDTTGVLDAYVRPLLMGVFVE